MNKRLLALICVLSVLLGGCTYSNLGVDGLLTAPKLSKEQSIIHKALIDSVGKNIKLKYPKKGDNRSAFVVANIDDEPTNEAIVFYEKINSGQKDSSIRINVLDQFEGQWKSVYDLHGVGTEIERINISKLGSDETKNIIIGFNMINRNEKALQIYNYSDKVLNNVYSDSYSIMDIMDIDQDENSELITITNSSASEIINAKVLKSIDGAILNVDNMEIQEKIVSFVGSTKGFVKENTPAIFVDIQKENGAIQTEVFYYRNNIFYNPMVNSYTELREKTTRPIGYSSLDVDNDGIVEIPVTSVFWGYEEHLENEQMLLTNWYSFSYSYNLEKKHMSYYNLNDSYVLMLPSRWQGMVTVSKDTTTDEIVFYKYEPEKETTEEMTELMRIRVATRDNVNEYISEGYSVIKTKGQIYYLVKSNKSDSFALSTAELSDNFYVL